MLAGVLALAVEARAQAQSPRAGAEVLRVITHTQEYCNQLSAYVDELRRQTVVASEEARHLAQEGDRMCLQGQIRPGIIRLRRAMMLLRGQVPGK